MLLLIFAFVYFSIDGKLDSSDENSKHKSLTKYSIALIIAILIILQSIFGE